MSALTTRPMPPAEGVTGVYHGIDIDDYHGGAGVSKTALDDFRKAPYLYWANRFDPTKPAEEEKPSHRKGNLMHCAFLEPEQFSKRYVMPPDDAPKKPDSRQLNAKNPSPDTIKAIAWWDKFNLANEGKTNITAKEYDTAWRQADSLRKIKAVAELALNGKPEVSAYWVDPVTGLYCRCRPDWVSPINDFDILLDAKGAVDARPAVFARVQAGRMRYHVQDAYYTEGWTSAAGRQVGAFLFAIVEPEWPYLANVVEFNEASKVQGRKDFREDLNGIAEHKKTGVWTRDTSVVGTIEIEPYLFTEE